MVSSPSLTMRRVYYATMIVGLLAGAVFFAATVRYGWAETQDALGSLFLPENEISIPADFPVDVPIYDPNKLTVTLYGFDYGNGEKAHRLNYRLDGGVAFNTVTSYYRQALKSQGWTTGESQPGQAPAGSALVEFATFTSEKADATLTTHVSTQKGGLDVEMRYAPKDMQASSPDDDGADLPEDFPTFMPTYSVGGLFSYEIGNEGGSNRYRAYFQVPGSEASVSDLKDFYTEWVLDEGWKKTKESSLGKEYLAFSDGIRQLEIVIQSVDSGQGGYYQVMMQTAAVQAVSQKDTTKDIESAASPLMKGTAMEFTDVPNGYGYGDAISALQEAGILKGYGDGTFQPGKSVNRAEFLKTVLQAAGVEPHGSACFMDVKEEWFAPAICQARADNIVSGYGDGKFHPERDVSRAEAVKIVLTAFDLLPDDLPEGWYWYDKYFSVAESGGYLGGMGDFQDYADKPLTRGEMAQLILNAVEK